MNRPGFGTALAIVWCALAPTASPQEPSPGASPGVQSGRGAGSVSGPASQEEAVVETDAGAFVIALRKDLAPRHVAHFVKTARAKGYDGTLFHRLVPRAILQGGDPLSRDPKRASLHGTGGLGLLKSEFSSAPMVRGSVAAVLRPRDPHSGGSQFFICLFDQPSLTGKFTIFGEVKEGLELVDKIADVPVVGERPQTPIVIRKITIRGAP